jgi:Domain of unknown function (DUF2017)
VAVRRVKRSRAGDFVLRIPPPEREVLGTLPEMLRELLAQDDRTDPALRRLFPSAYPDDEEAAAEFESVVRDDLVAQRTVAIETMERTLQASRLTEDELLAWLAAMNDLRLVLGVRLAVTEKSTPEDFDADPQTQASYGLYAYLSYLEEDVVEALSTT